MRSRTGPGPPAGRAGAQRASETERVERLTPALTPQAARGFLHLDEIMFQMFVGARYVEHELPFVLDRLADPALLAESAVGEPPTVEAAGLTTSANTGHHVHHLLRYEELTGRRLAEASCVVEWGAGYGNLAKLLLLLGMHHGDPLEPDVLAAGARAAPLGPWMPGQHYFVR